MILSDDTIFKSTLENYKKSLLSLYDKKTVALAERETARFRYLSAFRSDLESIMSLAIDRVYDSRNELASTFIRGILKDAVYRTILMINQNGSVPATNYILSRNYAGYTQGAQLLKPINDLLGVTGETSENHTYIIGQWEDPARFGNPYNYGAIHIQGGAQTVSPPYSVNAIIEDLENYNALRTREENVLAAEIVFSVITDSSLSGAGFSLTDIIKEGRKLMLDIFKKTRQFFRYHEEILGAEAALANFIEGAKQAGQIDATASYSDIYKSLMESKAVTEAVEEEIKLEPIPVVATQIVEAQPKKSGISIPLLLAAAGIFVATRGE